MRFYRSLPIVGVLLLASACANERGEDAPPPSPPQDDVVSLPLAQAVAETYPLVENARNEARHVESVSVLEDGDRGPAMYGFNFEEGGWVVVSATLDYAPVLAFSDEGAIDVKHLVPGADAWADGMRETIHTVRTELKARDEAIDWAPALARVKERQLIDEAVLARAVRRVTAADLGSPAVKPRGVCATCEPGDPGGGGGTAPICTRVGDTWRGPLLQTYWSQGCGYNEFAPGGGSSANCFRHVAGCGPVAGAQVIRYWQHAKNRSYAWSSMYNGFSWEPLDNDPRARLLRDVGDAAQSTYGMFETGTTLDNLDAAMKSYGYLTSIGYLSQGDPVSAEVAAGRPVIVRGKPSVGSGHIWVADGTVTPVWGPTGCRPPAGEHKYYHYNWGWGVGATAQTTNNGWYLGNSFGSFNFDRRFITARPN